MGKSPAFQLYSNDFFVDTITWELDQLGLYSRLLFVEWSNGPLENDLKKLAKIAGISPKKFSNLFQIVSTKFVCNDEGKLINLRLEEERAKQVKYRETQSLKGKASAAKRSTAVETPVEPRLEPRFQPTVNSSSSSSSSLKKKNNKKEKIEFIENHFQNIPDDLRAKWKEVAPGIDIDFEISKAELWLVSNPEKKRSRYSQFLSKWMVKAQENFIRYGGKANAATAGHNYADQSRAAREAVYEQGREKDSLPAESRARVEALRKASRDAGRDDAPDFQDG